MSVIAVDVTGVTMIISSRGTVTVIVSSMLEIFRLVIGESDERTARA